MLTLHPSGYSQLMLHTDTNEENLGAFITLLDIALQHEVGWDLIVSTLRLYTRREKHCVCGKVVVFCGWLGCVVNEGAEYKL